MINRTHFILILLLFGSCSVDGFKEINPPRNLVGESIGTDRILISWEFHEGEASHFKLNMYKSDDTWLHETKVSGHARRFVAKQLEPETEYLFRLTACDQDHCTEPSSSLQINTQAYPSMRSEMDRPDDIDGPQVHVIYAVPSDRMDRQLDVNGTLAASIASFHNWFKKNSGLQIRFDTYLSEVDITFHRLRLTDGEMKPLSNNLVLKLEEELRYAGLISEEKVYLIYYDGSNDGFCGSAAWPPLVPGQTAALYLHGTISPSVHCNSQSIVKSATEFPRYWEFAGLHDLLHVFGLVAENAPGHYANNPAHVEAPADLMHGGSQPWRLGNMTGIDILGNNYFGPDVPANVLQLADVPFVEPVTDITALYSFDDYTPEEAAKLIQAIQELPMHAPFHLQ